MTDVPQVPVAAVAVAGVEGKVDAVLLAESNLTLPGTAWSTHLSYGQGAMIFRSGASA